jgi:hypothetical protein
LLGSHPDLARKSDKSDDRTREPGCCNRIHHDVLGNFQFPRWGLEIFVIVEADNVYGEMWAREVRWIVRRGCLMVAVSRALHYQRAVKLVSMPNGLKRVFCFHC